MTLWDTSLAVWRSAELNSLVNHKTKAKLVAGVDTPFSFMPHCVCEKHTPRHSVTVRVIAS